LVIARRYDEATCFWFKVKSLLAVYLREAGRQASVFIRVFSDISVPMV
jgi:hypothetical protein